MNKDDPQNCPNSKSKETFYMNNYSNLCKYLKQEIVIFLEKIIPKNTKRPVKKFVYDMTYGILKTGSTVISDIARTLEKDNKLIHIEKRLTDNLTNISFDTIGENLIKFNIENLCKTPFCINIDESDIIKPYGFKFEDLGYIHDGSKEGRPKEKGYSVTGIVGIGKYDTVIPLTTNIYSTHSHEFTSTTMRTLNHIHTITSMSKEKFTAVFDRGYDGSILMNELNKMGIKYVIRTKSQRIYTFRHFKANIDTICKKVKGKYSSYFENKNRDKALQKFTPLHPTHDDINHKFWLVFESVNSDNDNKVYITNIDCSTKEACINVLKSYRMRWRIEEYFRFIKGEYSFEKFRVRNLKAINNLSTLIMIATSFITYLVINKNKVYHACLDTYSAFEKNKQDREIIEQYGQNGLMLYRVKRGIQTILEHSNSVPVVPGRDQSKPKTNQMSLFDMKLK